VHVAAFVRGLARAQLPDAVVAHARRCLLDLCGVAAAGWRTPASSIMRGYAADQLVGRDLTARMLFDGRRVGLAGAALAGAATIDAFDAHDGHPLVKGHAGAAVLPALLAFCDALGRRVDGDELIVALAIGYEVGTRAGIALHGSVPDFHCSGAWNALAAAAVGARLLQLDAAQLRHALGIAEYFGPRGQILRVCDHPTMVKDGTAWGAHAGVTAALLARAGFTGAPALTVEADALREVWQDLGTRWRILEQYFKPYPVCRWAQPAMEAALALKREHRIDSETIAQVRIDSFAEAIALGSQCRHPATTDEAQYSLTYPVAAALVHGTVGASELDGAALHDPRVRRVVDAMQLREDPAFSRRFPAERFARVRITLRDGRELTSTPAVARGSAENPLGDDEIARKYRALAEPVLGAARTARIATMIAELAPDRPAVTLLDDLLDSV
jgi:2-methylcitrate dehydratase PrpD